MQSSKMIDDREGHSVLNTFDFAAIEEMDPSLGTVAVGRSGRTQDGVRAGGSL